MILSATRSGGGGWIYEDRGFPLYSSLCPLRHQLFGKATPLIVRQLVLSKFPIFNLNYHRALIIMPSSSSSSSTRRHGHGHSSEEKTGGGKGAYKSIWVWTCCGCQNSTQPIAADYCTEFHCNHLRCGDCELGRVTVREP